jgi:hypothetical protein
MHKTILPTLKAGHSIHAAHRLASAWPGFWRSAVTAIVILSGAVPATARDEAAVGQCGLTFVNTGDECERLYGGAGYDPPDGDKLNACWDKASNEYNTCMDKAEATMGSTGSPPKPKVNIRTPPSAGILDGNAGLQTQGPSPAGRGMPSMRGRGSGTLY